MAREIVSLTDPDTGATARILPSVGCNCFQFLVPTASGNLDVLWAEPGFAMGDRRASGSGIPLLFPFPGRLSGTSLHWDGRDWPLEPGDGLGNALHGFVHERAWRVVDVQASRLTAEFQASRDDPQLLNRWPADFRISVEYAVSAGRLTARYRIENPGPRPLPCGFGTHPYFRLPLGGQAAGACRVRLPVTSRWELANMIPTGQQLPLADPARFQNGQPFSDMNYDDVFSGLTHVDDWCEATIDDPQSGRRVSIRFDQAFCACVVYTPPHREAICIEPYTSVPDAPRLEQRGIPAGLKVLDAGAVFEARMVIAVE